MASFARKAFDDNIKDVEKLMQLHTKEAGSTPGRKYNLEVLNKSAIVLITSYWESYCEDIANEALNHLIKYISCSDRLPLSLRKQIATEIKSEKNELSPWLLSDDKWRNHIFSKLTALQEKRNRDLNTPNTINIKKLFESTLGISDITKKWSWDKKMTIKRASEKLDKYVSLRCGIAHRGKSLKPVKKSEVTDYLNFIKKLAGKTGGSINIYLFEITGKYLWQNRRINRIF